ncbi:MAG: putative signal transducing protein [Caulobacteraceae bacterium]
MLELLRTTDPVKLSAALALLADGGVEAEVFDSGAGNLWQGVIPQRLMVRIADRFRAERLLSAAGFRKAADGDWDLHAS